MQREGGHGVGLVRQLLLVAGLPRQEVVAVQALVQGTLHSQRVRDQAGVVVALRQAEVKAAAPKTPAKITSSQKSKPVAKTPAAPKVKKEAVPEITLTPFDWYAAAKERFSVAKKREAMGYVSAERFARLVVEGEEA